MKIKEGKSALEQNLYRSFLLLSATLVLISLGFTLFFDISRQRKDMDKLISGTASYIAAIPDVAAMLENGYPDSTVTRDLDSLLRIYQISMSSSSVIKTDCAFTTRTV